MAMQYALDLLPRISRFSVKFCGLLQVFFYPLEKLTTDFHMQFRKKVISVKKSKNVRLA